MNRFIHATQHPAVGRSVLQGVNATLSGGLAYACIDRTIAAESIRSGNRVPLQDDAGVAVILEQSVEGSYREAARCSVA